MSKTICTNIKFQYAYNFQSISGNNYSFKAGFDWIKIPTTDAELQNASKNVNAGTYISQSLTLKAFAADINVNDLADLPLIFLVTIEDESTELLGSLQFPAKMETFNEKNDFADISILQEHPI
ncbi:MAG: hypothetical protein PF448_13015 [Bacteroidales bacterium]|jgi:hypothetical protein|nr:hypothetical protein [Bacteroidales bacterium]